MNFAQGLSAALISVATILGVQSPVVVAQLNQEAMAKRPRYANASIAQQVTVLIDGQNPGSGVIIGKDGNTYSVLTAKHVVPRQDDYNIIGPDNQQYGVDYSNVKQLPDVDLAIIQFTSNQNYNVAEFGNSDQVQLGKNIYIGGWSHPEPPITDNIFRFVDGTIAALPEKPLPAGYQLIYTNITRSGMSGGPVLNQEGNIIGIHGQAEGREVYLPDYETIHDKTGFNLGIPINTFLALAGKTKISLP